jgi:putative ABC transport system permease protein
MILEARLLMRDWRGGRLSLILSSLILAVTVVTAVSLVADRVEQGLSRQVSSFLAADLVVSSGIPMPGFFQEQAETSGLQVATTARFESMVFSGDHNHLASVKAVTDNYPLRGELVLSEIPFASNTEDWLQATAGPPPGEAWIDERLLPLLSIELGDEIEVGYLKLRATKVVITEPDRGSGFSIMGARVLMNASDLEAAGVILPGSRIRYRLLLAGDVEQVETYRLWAEANLTEHERIRVPEDSEERLSNALERGRGFLLLAGTVGVLLAGVALALGSHRYAYRLTDQVALMKSWGQSAADIRRRYLVQLAELGIFCTAVGMCIGWFLHFLLLNAIEDLLPQGLPPGGIKPYLVAMATGFMCILGFSLPALWHLPAIEPLRVLRRDIPVSALSRAGRLAAGIVTIVLLVLWYSSSLVYAGLFMLGILGVVLTTGLISTTLLRAGKSLGNWAGSFWRLALANLWRRGEQTLVQLIAFSSAIMLLLVMISIRTSLLDEWRMQIPDDAPNHFLVNVAPHELQDVNRILSEYGIETPRWYPLVRGRATQKNGSDFTPADYEREDDLRRELNMTWADELPDANEIMAGNWWGQELSNGLEFSLEEDIAADIGVEIGDMMTFSVGGQKFEARLSSIRRVNWDSLNPNFYVVFPRQALDPYPGTWLSSVYVEREDRLIVNDLLSVYPTMLVIGLEEIFERVRFVILRVSQGIGLMLIMILACGVMVLFAAIGSTFDERMQESAVLRTLGSSSRLVLGSLTVEFVTLGLIAGGVAAICAEAVIMMLQWWVFELPVQWHPSLWLLGPVSGMTLVGGLGLLRSRKLVKVPPLESLRSLD